MNLNTQLDTLAELAGLNIADSEREKLVSDMESILGYVEQLQNMDVEDKEFERVVIDGDNHRDDVVGGVGVDEIKAVVDNFPAVTDDDLLIAHGVLEHKL